jgi:hypothetical protein
MVVLEHLDKQGKQKTAVFGNAAMGTMCTNVTMSMAMATQRPTVTLKLKPSPTVTGSWPVAIEFDADYLQSMRIVSCSTNAASPHPALQRFVTARKSAVSFGGGTQSPEEDSPPSALVSRALDELDEVMLLAANSKRKFGTYMHYQLHPSRITRKFERNRLFGEGYLVTPVTVCSGKSSFNKPVTQMTNDKKPTPRCCYIYYRQPVRSLPLLHLYSLHSTLTFR